MCVWAVFAQRGSYFFFTGATKILRPLIFFLKVPPKNAPFGFFCSKDADKNLQVQIPGILVCVCVWGGGGMECPRKKRNPGNNAESVA